MKLVPAWNLFGVSNFFAKLHPMFQLGLIFHDCSECSPRRKSHNIIIFQPPGLRKWKYLSFKAIQLLGGIISKPRQRECRDICCGWKKAFAIGVFTLKRCDSQA